MNPKKPSRFNGIKKYLAGLLLACMLQPPSHAMLPDLGSAAEQSLSAQEKTTLKQAFLKALYDSHKVNTNPVLNQWLTTLGQHLAQYAHLEQRPIFLLIDDPQVNAFAGPGGVIGIHTGLILKATSTDEVAAVIAHELGHIQQHHLLRRIHSSNRSQIASIATLLAAILIGQQNPQAGMAVFYTGNGLNMQQQLAFSRTHETEADAIGIDILAQAGFNPKAMAAFFEKLARMNTFDTHALPEILRTHPTSPHRMAAAENRATQLKPLQTPPKLIERTYLPYMQALISPDSLSSPQQRCFLHLSKHPDSKSCSLQLNGWLKAWLTVSAADQTTRKALQMRYPQNLPIQLKLAHKVPPAQALTFLYPLTQTPSPLSTFAYKALSRYSASLNPDESKLYAAWASFLQGNTPAAQHLIKEIDHSKLTGNTRLSLQALEKQTKADTDHTSTPNKNLFSH